jgi:hypothetical protein
MPKDGGTCNLLLVGNLDCDRESRVIVIVIVCPGPPPHIS